MVNKHGHCQLNGLIVTNLFAGRSASNRKTITINVTETNDRREIYAREGRVGWSKEFASLT